MQKPEALAENITNYPALIVLGGGSVTGKSVLARRLRGIQRDGTPIPQDSTIASQAIAKGFEYITPETIIASLPVDVQVKMAKTGLRHPEKLQKYIHTYYKALEKLVVEHLQAGKSVLLDDHCDKKEKIILLLDTVHQQKPETQTALIGLFVGPDISLILQERAKICKGVDYRFMQRTAQNFCNNFDEYTHLFDTTILIENLYNDIGITSKHISDNGIAREIYKNDEGYKTFQCGTKAQTTKIPKRKIVESENRHESLAERIRGGDSAVLPSGTQTGWQERFLASFPAKYPVR